MLLHQGYSRDNDQSDEQTAESNDSDDDTYIHQEIVQQPKERFQGTIDLFWKYIIFAHFNWRWY